jgi:Tol biopolymer transport system component
MEGKMRILMITIFLLCYISIGNSENPEPQYKIAFVVEPEGKNLHQLFIINLDGTNRVPLTDIQMGIEESPNWTPDGNSIVFTSTRNDFPENNDYDNENMLAGYQIYIAQLNNSHPTLLTHTHPDSGLDNGASRPVLSPNGQYVAFQHQSSTFVMGVDGSQPSLLLKSAFGPVWSPDSCCVILTLLEQTGENVVRNIIRVDIATREVVRLTDYSGIAFAMEWSAVAHQLLIMSDHSGSSEIYRMTPNGTEIFSLTHDPAHDEGRAFWSPNGKWIAYGEHKTDDPYAYNLVIITPEGKLLTRLEADLVGGLEWLSDSTRLLFYGPAYDEQHDSYYKGIQQLNTACLEADVIQCSMKDITSIPGTKSPSNSSFAISPITLPSD